MAASEFCRLCVNICNDYKSLYDENGGGNEYYDITFKLLHPLILDLRAAKHLTRLCSQCWNHISDFHAFQNSIAQAQLKLLEQDTIKTEVDIESEEIQHPSGFSIVVKQEDFATSGLDKSEVESDNPLQLLKQEEVYENEDGPNNYGGSSIYEVIIKDELENQTSTSNLPEWSEQEPLAADKNTDITDNEDDDEMPMLPECLVEIDILPEETPTAIEFQENMGTTHAELNSNPPCSMVNTKPSCDDNSDIWQTHHAFRRLEDITTKLMPSVRCVICQNCYPTLSSVCFHFQEQHPLEVFYISCCSQKLLTPDLMLQHMYQHNDQHNFRCNLCGNTYSTKSYLKRHRNQKHFNDTSDVFHATAVHGILKQDQPVHICQVCGKGFSKPENLRQHRLSQHTSLVQPSVVQSYECTRCGKKFSFVRLFDNHICKINKI